MMDSKLLGGLLLLIFSLFGALVFGQYKLSLSIRQAGYVKADEVCYADVYAIAERQLLKLGLEGKTKNEIQKQVDLFLRELRSFSPEKIGCRYLFIKGALVKGGRDVTKELEDYLNSHSVRK